VARLTGEAGIQGVTRRKKRPRTTITGACPADDLVKRDFTASSPDQLWVADITYVPTDAGFLYLAVVLDAFSRKVIGWKMADHLRTALVTSALDMAVGQRDPDATVHHSDRGSQYTSIAFGKRPQASRRPSFHGGRTCYDNALCESFFATLECELIDRERFASQAEAHIVIFEFIEAWYNHERQHSSLEYHSPTEFENQYLHSRPAA
jgi:putative transposase